MSLHQVVSFFTVLPLPSPEKVCVASCSLEAFWFCYSILKSPEKNIKKPQKEKKETKKRGKKSKRQHRRGALCVCFSFLLCGGALWLPWCPGPRL
jgi:hypothetical protein